MKRSLIVVLAYFLFEPTAQACLQIPEELTLTGSSFADTLKLGVGTNCGASLQVVSNDKSDQSIAYFIRAKDGKLCLTAGANKDCVKGPFVIRRNGKAVAVLEQSAQGTFLLSAKPDGKRDPKKPYLQLTAFGAQSAKIEAKEAGETIGRMEAAGEECSRALGGGEGKLEMRGKLYVTDGAGCKGAMVGQDFPGSKGGTGNPTTGRTEQ